MRGLVLAGHDHAAVEGVGSQLHLLSAAEDLGGHDAVHGQLQAGVEVHCRQQRLHELK